MVGRDEGICLDRKRKEEQYRSLYYVEMDIA